MHGLLTLLLALSHAGPGMLTCDDLSPVQPTPAVDFSRDIQPIFDGRCSFCHGFNGGLSLEAGEAREALTCQPTQTQDMPAGALRVVPYDAMSSWLFTRVNCADQNDSGFRMPPFGQSLSLADQRLIADWIDQGALPTGDHIFVSGFGGICGTD